MFHCSLKNLFFINLYRVSKIRGRSKIKKPIGLKITYSTTSVKISRGLNENKLRIIYRKIAAPITIKKVFDLRDETKRIINIKKINESPNSIF